MKKYLLVACLLVSTNVMSATAVFSGGQLIGFDGVNLAGFGLFDTRFHDTWQGDIYDLAFVNATGVDALSNFTGSGSAQGTVLDDFPSFTLGCESSLLCGWVTVYNKTATQSGSILSGGIFYNWNNANDFRDNTGLTSIFENQALAGSVDRTFLTWTSSNVSAVPVPAAVFMFAPALLGFLGFRRKMRA